MSMYVIDPWIQQQLASELLIDPRIYEDVASKLVVDPCLLGRPEADLLGGGAPRTK